MPIRGSYSDLFERRSEYSEKRLIELGNRLCEIAELDEFPKLTIFGAGSYARLEASKFSDIDLFFLHHGSSDKLEPKRLFAKVTEIVNAMKIPAFSNEYLEILYTDDMIINLGSPKDDYDNHFTTRMLLLLESWCLCRDEFYNKALEEIINSYFRDYHDHEALFRPVFLINDITRYWKTLCMNYEHTRNQPADDEETKLKQKIMNFKLKYSRMTTCFATVAYLFSLPQCNQDEILSLVRLTPRQRLERICYHNPGASQTVDSVLEKYSWFIEKTELSTEDLYSHFSDKAKRTKAFEEANKYGDTMFKLLCEADKNKNLIRYLVI